MISIQYSQIPAYLHNGAFFRNLSDTIEDDDIQVPEKCYSPDDSVNSVEELEKALQIAAFWLLDSIPRGVIKYCYETEFSVWCDAIGSKYGRKIQQLNPLVYEEGVEFAFAHTLWSIFNADSYDYAFTRAIDVGASEVVVYLIECPNAEKTPSSAYKAAHAGRLDFLKLLHQHGFPWDNSASRAASSRGHLDCLRYLHENGCPWDVNVYKDATHLDCVQYAFEHGLEWHPQVSVAFASWGKVDCLQYAVAHGCPLDKAAVMMAARNGHVKALQFLHEHGCEWDSYVYVEAAGRSHLSVVQYAFEHHLEWHPDTCVRLAEKNSLEILRYAVQRGCPLTAKAATHAAIGGYVDCLRCLLEAGCPLEADTCTRTCIHGHVECLRLLFHYGAVCTIDAARAAATHKQWACMRFLCEQGCPTDHTIASEAVKKGQTEVLRCAMENGCPYSDDVVFEAAQSEKNGFVSLRYLVEDQGLYMNEDGSIFVAAFARGDYACVQYLLDVGYESNVCSEELLRLWQQYLTEHVKYTHYYEELVRDLDKNLFMCIDYAMTHGWDVGTNGTVLSNHIRQYRDKYPLCYALLNCERVL